jgi:predicted TPR repeat methyltransferase
MNENFNLYSQYYDLIYHDKTYLEEVEYICGEIDQTNLNAKSILELGCGSGGHAHFLSQKGFQITGIDQSESMIQQARKKEIPNFNAEVGNIIDFELNKKFDVAISLFHVLSYLTQNEDLSSCFQSVNRHLNLNGTFIFDVWFTPAVYHLKPESRLKSFENNDILVERSSKSVMDLQNNTIDVHFDIQINQKNSGEHAFLQENHMMRHFSIPEIKMLASLTGFEVLKSEELITKQEPSLDTWAITFVLQKTSELV